MVVRVGSLFAGIGGFDLAAQRAGMELAWCSEIDKYANRVLDHHWPHVKNLGDIHGITDAPRVDVLIGGFPCQDYSVAGARGGLAGDRGALWWQFHRLIAELHPAWIVGENVPGLLSSNGGRDFETIIGSLTELGYGVAWAVLDAQYFGVAQRRRRVFVVGHFGGVPRPEVLAVGEGVFGHPEPRRETGQRVAALTANGLGGGGPDDNLAQAGHVIGFKHKAGAKAGTTGAVENLSPSLQALQPLAVAFAQNQRDEVRELDVASSVNAERWGTAKNETLLADPPSVRRLTPLECERLQGFPDGWTDIPGNSDTQRYRQLGNAVAVPVAEWIMRRVLAVGEML